MSEGERPVGATAATGRVVERSEALGAIDAARHCGEPVGVVLVDIDRFHRINTRFGQAVGDRVLGVLVAALAEVLPEGALVAQAEGDAFVAVLRGVGRNGLREVADALLARVRAITDVDGLSLTLRASAGVAWHAPEALAGPAAGEAAVDVRSLDVLEAAFLACRRAKATMPGSVADDDDGQGVEVQRLEHFEDELRHAIADDQLVLHLQPELDLHDGSVTGLEALVRWQHPEHGLLAPGRFLADAEAVGLTMAIGDWVVGRAIELAAEVRDRRGGRPVRVWVNLAAAQVADGRRLCERLRDVFASGVIGPECLGLEVTESSLLEDLPGAVEVLRALRDLGVELALDDFGTGYSSLSYLRQLPVGVVKIDQRFVGGIGDSLADEAIIEAVIDLAHALGLHVIAEGIEHAQQAEALRWMNADAVQGYYFGRPAPIDTWVDRLDEPWLGALPPGGATTPEVPRTDHPSFAGSARARLLLTALDTAHDSVVVTAAGEHDAVHRPIVYVNSAFEDETGFRAADMVGGDSSQLLVDADDPDVVGWFERVAAAGTAATTELLQRRADGSAYLCELTINPIFDERGAHTHWLHVRRDLSERRASEAMRGFAVQLAQRSLEQGADAVMASAGDIVEGLAAVLHTDLCYLNLIDARADEMRLLAQWARHASDPGGDEPAAAPALAATGAGRVPLAKMQAWTQHLASTDNVVEAETFASERPIVDPDRPWRAELAALFPVAAYGSSMYAPLRVEGTLVGVIGVARSDPNGSWSDEERQMLKAVADTLANLVSRGQATEALRASESRLAAMLDAVSDVLVVLDQDGYVQYANPAVQRRLGHDPRDVVGRHFLTMVHPDDRSEAVAVFTMALSGAELPVLELRVMDADGRGVWCDFDTNGVYDEQVGGFMISLRDMTVQRSALDEMARRAEIDRLVTEMSLWALEPSVDDVLAGIAPHFEQLCTTMGVDGAFVEVIDGPGLRHLVGWARDDAPPDTLAVPHDPATVAPLVERYRTLEPIVVDDIDRFDEPWADAWRAFNVSDRAGVIVPLSSGRVCLGALGVLMVDRPRTWGDDEVDLLRRVGATMSALIARRQAEMALRQSQDRLNALLDGANDIVVVVSSDGVIRYANNAVRKTLGLAPDTFVGRHVSGVVHPDDLPVALAAFAALHADERPSPITVRLLRADGEAVWSEITAGGTPDPVAGGRVLTCRDVTARRVQEDRSAQWMTMLRFAFDLAQLALDFEPREFLDAVSSFCDRIAALLGVDHCYVDRLDERADELVNLGCATNPGVTHGLEPGDRIEVASLDRWVARLRQLDAIVLTDALESSEGWVGQKRGVLGSERGLMVVPMSAAGRLLGLIGVSMEHAPRSWADDELTFLRIVAETVAHVLERDEVDAERRRLEAELEWQALHDPLTGLGNRILLGKRLDSAIAERSREHHVTVLLIDLDHFKHVNDTHGHAFGDDVLQIVAQRLVGLTRPTDTLARTGGDEFVLLCPQTDAAGAQVIAERMIAAIGEPIRLAGVTVQLGASIGIAQGDGDLELADALLVEADDAMYAAKRAGRGTMRFAGAAR